MLPCLKKMFNSLRLPSLIWQHIDLHEALRHMLLQVWLKEAFLLDFVIFWVLRENFIQDRGILLVSSCFFEDLCPSWEWNINTIISEYCYSAKYCGYMVLCKHFRLFRKLNSHSIWEANTLFILWNNNNPTHTTRVRRNHL